MESQSIDLKNESNRLGTFAGWPVSFIISPKSLAAAGFYYTNHTDKVKCAFCNICICHWEFGDNAIDEHKRHNPECSFILSENCGNIPIIEGIQLRGEFVETHKETGEPIDIQGLGVRAHRVAYHLNYNSYCARLKTYRGWKNESQKPEDLATAGFFFTGSNDEVRCYYCDGGLQNWEVADNPWVEHAKWFPNCGYLNLVKGEKFLDESLVERFNALLSRSRSDDSTSSTQEGHVVSIHQTDNPPENENGTRRPQVFSNQLINDLMLSPPSIMALEIGLQPSRVRQAIINNLEDTGRPFRSMDSFIQQILSQDSMPYSTDSDIMSLQEILRRERNINRSNVTVRELSSDDSTVSDDTNESDDDIMSLQEILRTERNINRSNVTVPELSSDDSTVSDDTNESDDESDSTSDDGLLLLSEPRDLSVTNSQNENQTPNANESTILNDSVIPSQTSDIKVEEEVKIVVPSVEPESTKLSQSDLEEENRRLKEARLCKICLDQELGVVMLPCAHLVACITCASSLPDCPLCRQTIKATVRTFLS